jgi:hypothetical protein
MQAVSQAKLPPPNVSELLAYLKGLPLKAVAKLPSINAGYDDCIGEAMFLAIHLLPKSIDQLRPLFLEGFTIGHKAPLFDIYGCCIPQVSVQL